MKKSIPLKKLSLKKLTISKLTNSSMIQGGSGICGDTNGTRSVPVDDCPDFKTCFITECKSCGGSQILTENEC